MARANTHVRMIGQGREGGGGGDLEEKVLPLPKTGPVIER
jgi:hypothetical protein